MLPAPSSIAGKQEQKETFKPAYNRQLPDAKLESEHSSHGHASLNSKRSQAARKVIQHRRDINQKRLPAVTEESSKPRRPSLPEVDHFDLESEDTLTLAGFLNPPVEQSVPKACVQRADPLCCLIVSLTVWMLQRAAQNGLLETREVSDRYWKATGNTDPVDRRHPSQSMDQTLETINREQGKPETQSRERRTEQDREAPEDASLTAALDPPTPLQHPAQRAHRIQPTTNAAPDGWWSETTIILEGQDLEDARSFFLCVSSECCTPTNPAGAFLHEWSTYEYQATHAYHTGRSDAENVD
eukprot:s5854_g1.t1